MKIRNPTIGFLVAAVALVACSAMSAAPEAPTLDGTAWTLSSLPGRTWAGAPATARFEGGRVLGSDGCNRYSAPYTTQGSAFEVGARGVSTMMACPPEVMKRAEAFMAALGGAKTYRVANGQLELLGANGTVLAVLAVQSQSLAGTSWSVTGINNGKGGLVSLLTGSKVTMMFASDGRVAGSAGCNQYTSVYEAQGSRFAFKAPAATRKLCPGEGLMQQEQQFLKALESVATMQMEGNRIEMRDAQGALQVTATREGGA